MPCSIDPDAIDRIADGIATEAAAIEPIELALREERVRVTRHSLGFSCAYFSHVE